MSLEISWTADRIAATGLGVFLIFFLHIFFFGRRPTVSARPLPSRPQEITIIVAGGYTPDSIVARKDMPLKLIFDRRESNPCSDEVVLPEFQIRRSLPAHQKTVIEVVPRRTGEFPFSCGMNMLHGKIRVVES
ncbi:MAG TPA: cupredoxin domain-containing protein [Thermoanaerobaculia bacterium]|nr:cupredoxin domain-containing protein [Thermoanaerobaculia bacterium]